MRAMPAGSCFHPRSVDLFHLVSPFLLLPDIGGVSNWIANVRFMPEWLALCDLGAPGWGEPWFPQKAVLLLSQLWYGDVRVFVFLFCAFVFCRHTILRMIQGYHLHQPQAPVN